MADAKKNAGHGNEPAKEGAKKPPSEGKSSGMASRLIVVGFVSMVVVAETMIFFFMVPSGEEVAALAEARLIAAAREIDAHQEHETEKAEKIVEFDLGTYSVSFVPAGADHNYRVEFRLFATVNEKDKEHLQALMDEKQFRFRHRLILEIRNTSLQDLSENQLGLIQRRILATSTEVLGEPVLLSVGFNDYQVIED
ncbi:MAG: dihydrolipoamide acetyltransferase [Pirellula sp.]|jgi:flagellar basal body-associated protein FliL|nr:dihydrolipoamide acetyltransferase [Pirellula sp.]